MALFALTAASATAVIAAHLVFALGFAIALAQPLERAHHASLTISAASAAPVVATFPTFTVRFATVRNTVARILRDVAANIYAVAVSAEAAVGGAILVGLATFADTVTAGDAAVLGTTGRVFSGLTGGVAAFIGLTIAGAVDRILRGLASAIPAPELLAINGARVRSLETLTTFAHTISAYAAAIQGASCRPFTGVAHLVATHRAIGSAGHQSVLPSFHAQVLEAEAVPANATVE